MTHCSLVSLVRLVQVHLALVPLKPSSGPLYPLPPLSLCPAKFHFNIATATKGYDQISPRSLVTIYALQRTILQTTLQNQNLQRLQLLYFLFPSLCVLPSQSWTIINILDNIPSYQFSAHLLCSGPWQYSKGNIQYSKSNIQGYQGSTHPLCSGPWPSCCRRRSGQRQSCLA